MSKKFPANPSNPERICWGCDKYCPVGSLACGNGSDRTQHPIEIFGRDWMSWGLDGDGGAGEEEKAAGQEPGHPPADATG